MSWFSAFLPDQISGLSLLALVVASYFTSAVSAAIGIGGGIMLLAIMANVIPPSAIIPVHATVQIGSTVGRVLTLFKHVDWSVVLWFSLGGVVGVLMGGQVAVALPPQSLQLAIGAFILYSTWMPIFRLSDSRKSLAILGGGTSFLSMFVGGVAPFIFVVLKTLLPDHRSLVSTLAAVLTFQALSKALVFGLFGFLFSDWYLTIALMVTTGFAGTLTGKLFLDKVPAGIAMPVMKVVLTLLAVRLVYVGISELL